MAVAQWKTLLRQCLLSRASPEDVVKLAQQKGDHNGKAILKALLDCRQSFCIPSDPLPAKYFESLLTSHTLALSDLLLILINKWNGPARATKPVPMTQLEIGSLQEISLLLTSRLVVDRLDTQRSLILASRWLIILVQSTSVTLNSQTAEAVGSLLATLSTTNIGITMLSDKRDGDKKSLKETVQQATEVAVASYPALSVHLIGRLGAVQKHIAMFDETHEQSSMRALQIQANIPETPMAASRAGTILYLETMIFTARTIDDTIVFNFLAGRHNNHWMAMFLDGLFASFQVLKRSRDGNRKALRFSQADIYIRNKLPSILATIAGSSFGVLSSEQALTSAWDQIRTELTTAEALLCGQHFLHVCSLHHLLSSEAAHQLIGDQQLTLNLPKGLYSKDELVSQVNSNHSRINKLIEELTHTDGSGAAISQTVVEMTMAFCQSKETHHLSDVANTILKNPVVINALAMFVRPSYWLGPLCTLLDEWRWDEIQGESQPVYEEFGSILLLVIASKRRLDLSLSEMGMHEGFVAGYFDQEGSEDTLSDRSLKHLGDWIHAMYMTEGLGDEVTTSCSPQEFYLLVPSLLRQSMVAHQKGKLPLEGLKGGLEYFLEPFLLPSLVSAITWAKNDTKAGKILLPIFTKATDNEIHRTILAMMDPAWTVALERGEDFEKEAAAYMAGGTVLLSASLRSLLQARGPETALQCILRILTVDFSTLDVMATLVCVADRSLRDLLRLKFTTCKDALIAEATVHLHRRVEAFASVLMVQDLGMEFAQLSAIDTTNANLDASQEQPVDDIDQVLNENAVMSSLEQPEMIGDASMDDFFGLQSDNMGLDDLDLDLDTMF